MSEHQRVCEYSQSIDAAPEAVFPLLCPVREKAWLPGWEARMIHSRSGRAELGAVFASPHAIGETVWVITRHEAPQRIGFVRWQPDGVVVEIDIALEAEGEARSKVDIRYVFTAVRDAAALQEITPAFWQGMMRTWESRMNAFLAR
jgi:hypothetical protein